MIVTHERDAEPVGVAGGASVHTTFDETNGSGHLHQSVVRLFTGGTCQRATGACEEVLFVLSGHGTLELDETAHPLEPQTGAHLVPGERYRLHHAAGEELVLVSTLAPDPDPLPPGAGRRRIVARLADEPVREASSDREFRIVCGNSTGCASVTQFVGYIPAGRTPDHFHEYDEVIYVLEGEGMMHAGGRDTKIGAGSCIHLAPRTVHCLERTSDAPMSVLGVFRPALSPAAAYYPDGTPAPVG